VSDLWYIGLPLLIGDEPAELILEDEEERGEGSMGDIDLSGLTEGIPEFPCEILFAPDATGELNGDDWYLGIRDCIFASGELAFDNEPGLAMEVAVLVDDEVILLVVPPELLLDTSVSNDFGGELRENKLVLRSDNASSFEILEDSTADPSPGEARVGDNDDRKVRVGDNLEVYRLEVAPISSSLESRRSSWGLDFANPAVFLISLDEKDATCLNSVGSLITYNTRLNVFKF